MRTAALVIAAVVVPSCTPGARQEAAQVAEAMDWFRKADNASKPATLGALRDVKCNAADVCKAREACLTSAEATSKSLVLKNEVEQALGAIESGKLPKESAEAQGLALKLDESTTLLEQGFAALPACDAQILDLKRKYAF